MSQDTTTSSQPKPEGPFTGGCGCRAVRYTLPRRPIYIHACHCRYCQRETGSSFALNAMYEEPLVRPSAESARQPELVRTPARSGNPQTIARCPECRVAVWSNYGKHGGDRLTVVRVGTLDDPGAWGFEPEMHIYTSTKQPWVVLPDHVPRVPEFYDFKDYWPQDRLDRLAKALS
ncbi:hypothetical protein KJ359_004148 [Pestalotiopsis sp. 9143b]|nr:hypothetical protein KJ359_004148 [Pestalotiopsis sp. 9143b]